MSKYNKIVSIPIESIPKEELAIAIKEWAENDDSLEELLWACYNNGLKTSGCHAGAHPYISFNYSSDKNELYIKIMDASLTSKGSQVLIRPDGGNPFSGSDWYKPDILLGSDTEYKDDADKQFELITKSINNTETIPTLIDTTGAINLLDSLIEKLTNINLRIKHDNNDNYIISIELSTNEDTEIFKFLNERLLPLGFKIEIPDEGNYKYWNFSSKDPLEFNKVLLQAAQSLINNYTLNIPSRIDDSDNLKIRAHIVRKQLSEDEFKEWLKEERKRLDNQYNTQK